jgi:hypothetical protein
VNWRPYIVSGCLVAVLGVDVYLAASEDIQGAQEMTTHNVLDQDPLYDIEYGPTERLTNLRRFGLSDSDAEDVRRRINRLNEDWSNAIKTLLKNAPEPDSLAGALCGVGSRSLPPRWAAMDFLVELVDGRLKPVDLSGYAIIESQDWMGERRVQSVYNRTERRASREDDATRMGLAAIFSGKHEQLLKGESPWGSGLFGGWDWVAVVKSNAGIQNSVYEYLALMHLTVEVAQGAGGICGR